MWPRARNRSAISRAVFSIADVFTSNNVAAPLYRGESEVRAGLATATERRGYTANGDFLSCRNEWIMKKATAMQIQESATLNAGHGCANGTCRSNKRKSITWP